MKDAWTQTTPKNDQRRQRLANTTDNQTDVAKT